MSLADELDRLQSLRERGALSDEEFARAKERILAGRPAGPAGAMDSMNRLRRSRSDRWIGGVCGGVAASTGVDSWIWRLILAALALYGGAGVVIYLLLWIFVPEE